MGIDLSRKQSFLCWLYLFLCVVCTAFGGFAQTAVYRHFGSTYQDNLTRLAGYQKTAEGDLKFCVEGVLNSYGNGLYQITIPKYYITERGDFDKRQNKLFVRTSMDDIRFGCDEAAQSMPDNLVSLNTNNGRRIDVRGSEGKPDVGIIVVNNPEYGTAGKILLPLAKMFDFVTAPLQMPLLFLVLMYSGV